ncbi:MAG: hypothetical protein WA966_09150 [Ornithinimicrobium sp.]
MSVLREAIKVLDPAPDKRTELTLALELITELSSSKADMFEESVNQSYPTAGTVENRTAPITLVIASHKEYRAYVKNDASKISEEVSGAVKKFVSGGSDNIIDGIASLVTTGLDVLLGGGMGLQQEMSTYYITAQSRALVRYDIRAWQRTVQATGITTQIESCLALYASKAAIDVTQLDLNNFLISYEDQLSKMGFTDNQISEYLDEAEATFGRLSGRGNGAGGGDKPDRVERGPQGKPRYLDLICFS